MREPLVRTRFFGASALRAFALGLALAAAPLPAEATSLAALSTEQMTDASDLVVRAKVLSVRTELDARGWVWTVAEVSVSRVLKGAAPDRLTVRTPGGSLDDKLHLVDGMPRFSKDEDLLMFLSARAGGDYLAVGGWQGKYTVRPDPVDGTALAVRFTVPYDQAYDARFLPTPPSGARVTLAALEDQVVHRVDVGWDGAPIPGISTERLRTVNHAAPGVK